ncbi:MAG: M28 family peptidase [Alphaproteobacteria bacterium]|nr:M28 family peptidase [Alphaproteobacteria bacterium]
MFDTAWSAAIKPVGNSLAACFCYIFTLTGSFAPVDARTADPALPQAQSQTDVAAFVRIENDFRWLSDDARNGRLAGSDGHRAAAAYVADAMARAGLAPAGAEGWRQPVRLVRATAKIEDASLQAVGDNAEPIEFAIDRDFAPLASPARRGQCEGPAVFAGFGVDDPLGRHTDVGAGNRLEGRVVLVLDAVPAIFDGEEAIYLRDRAAKLRHLSAAGASCVVYIQPPTAEQNGRPWDRQVRRLKREAWFLRDEPAPVPAVFLHWAAADRILGLDRANAIMRRGADAPSMEGRFEDLAVRIRLRTSNTLSHVESENVVGVLPAAAEGAGSAIVVTAHLDHLGPTTDAGGVDRIRNGAFDNALGVAVMLEVARRLAARSTPPAQQIAFVALTAEEQGLLGSSAFAAKPPSRVADVAANVNIDMPLLMSPIEDVLAIGAERSSLHSVAQAAARDAGLSLGDGSDAARGLFLRSDQFSFARKGAPATMLFVGAAGGGRQAFADFSARHYHQPSDEASLGLDIDAVTRFLDFAAGLVEAAADAPSPPKWVDGDFFKAASDQAAARPVQ